MHRKELLNLAGGGSKKKKKKEIIEMTENQDKVSKENRIAHDVWLNANKIVLLVFLAIRRLFNNTFLNIYVKEAHTAWNIFINRLVT